MDKVRLEELCKPPVVPEDEERAETMIPPPTFNILKQLFQTELQHTETAFSN